MQWQDIVLTTGQFVFSIALLPTVLGKDKPAFSTSLINGAVLMIFALTFATLSLWLTVIPTIIIGILWLVLAYQKYSLNKKKGL